jgi:hypothetical protein
VLKGGDAALVGDVAVEYTDGDVLVAVLDIILVLEAVEEAVEVARKSLRGAKEEVFMTLDRS